MLEVEESTEGFSACYTFLDIAFGFMLCFAACPDGHTYDCDIAGPEGGVCCILGGLAEAACLASQKTGRKKCPSLRGH